MTDVVVANVNNDDFPDIVTVSDGGTNIKLYLGPIEDANDDDVVDNTGTTLGDNLADNLADTSPSQSVDVADLDEGDLDIIVGNLDTPNVVYFQDGTPAPSPPDTPTSGDFTTTTRLHHDNPDWQRSRLADDQGRGGRPGQGRQGGPCRGQPRR